MLTKRGVHPGIKFNVWWVPGKKIISLPNRIYCGYHAISEKLWYHEMAHQRQFFGRKQQYGFIVGPLVFILYDWIFGWVKVGFRYSKIPAEIEAIECEKGRSNKVFLSEKDTHYGC